MKEAKISQLITIASNNTHKISEIAAVMPAGFQWQSLLQAGISEDLPEPFETLEENSFSKAFHIWHHYGLSCFSDDTGLEVEALDGKPGVHTAHFSGSRDANANMDALLKALDGKANRNAQFRTVATLIIDGSTYSFEGIVKGTIALEKAGTNGFGYDPIFIPEGYNQTFAQLPEEVKLAHSHRSKAIEKVVAFINTLND
jgi:XTP/dITP diphosphohydrolase